MPDYLVPSKGPILAAILVLSMLVLLCSPAPAFAQMTDHRWEWGFALGTANLDSSNEDFDLDFRIDFRGGYLFSDTFQLEVQMIHADAALDAKLSALMLNAVFNFRPEAKVVPYLLLGGGYSELENVSLFGTAPALSERSGALQMGFGSRLFLGAKQRMAIRVELSSLWINTAVFESDRHTSLTLGLSWGLGRRTAQPVE